MAERATRFMFVTATNSFVVSLEKAAKISEKVRVLTEAGTASMKIPEVGPVGQICITEFTEGTMTAEQCVQRLAGSGLEELCRFISASIEIGYTDCTKRAVAELSKSRVFDPVRALVRNLAGKEFVNPIEELP